MYSTNLVNLTRKEYFIVGKDYPNKIGLILSRLELLYNWDLRLDDISIRYENNSHTFTRVCF
jgi:hypothetical protein